MKVKTLLCLSLVTSMLLGVFLIGSVGAQSTTFGVEPVDKIDPSLVPGSWFTVEVWIRDVTDLAIFEFKLRYNTTILNATSITYGGIYGAQVFEWAKEIHDDLGWLGYSASPYFGQPNFDGDGNAAILNFTVDSYGDSALELYDNELRDSTGVVTHTAIDGFFSNVHIFLHAQAGLIDVSNPEGTRWHELLPTYSNRYNLTFWADMDNGGDLTYCDYIQMKNLTHGTAVDWYHVYKATVTINTTVVLTPTITRSPSSTSGGWTTGDGAYDDGGTYAYIPSGKPSASQYYGGYGFSIPTGATISSVKVRLDAWTGGNEEIHLKVSEDGGSTWLVSTWFTALGASETTYWVDVTGWTSWTPAKLNSDNIRTQVWAETVGGGNEVDLDWIPIEVSYSETAPMYLEFDDPTSRVYIQDFNWSNPLYTMWHEITPVFSRRWNLTGWTDNSPSNFTAGDDIVLNATALSFQVDEVSTDIIVKKLPSAPEIPEFPLDAVLPIALIIAIVYVWWTKKPKRVTRQQKPTSTISHFH